MKAENVILIWICIPSSKKKIASKGIGQCVEVRYSDGERYEFNIN